MATHSGNWYPVGPVKYDEQGNPYHDTSDGMRAYISPIAAAQERNDPKLLAWAQAHGANVTYGANDPNGNPTTSNVQTGAPDNSYMHGQPSWNADTGQWEYPNFFDTPFGSTVLGASAVTAPLAISALTSAPAAGGAAADAGDAAGLADGANAATAATAGGGADGLLPATATVPNTGALVPATTSSMAPGAGAGLPDWLKTAQDLGQSLGADAAGRAQGRNADNIANIGFAQAQNNHYNSELAAPQKIASNAVRGDILSSARDVSLAAPSDIPVPTISGGLRPSMFSDTTRQLGKNITANAAATPMPTPTPPVLQPMETAGPTDTILNTAGYLGNLAKPASDIWKMFNHG